MGPGDPFERGAATTSAERRDEPDALRPSERRLAIGFGLGALLGLSLWKLGLGATLAALAMGGLGMLVAARTEAVTRVARLMWERFRYRFLR